MGGQIWRADLIWAPQEGPQAEFVASEDFEVVYGGARGGGKTDGVLGDFALHAQKWKADAKGLLVRRTRVALEPTIARARQVFAHYRAAWRAARSCFEWPHGAVLYFHHLDNDAEADAFQGHEYSRVYVEELTQFPHPAPVDRLKATLRSAAGVRCAFRATCNPGGPGHAWVKARYIDPGPGTIVEEDGLKRMFIPAKLTDNRLLMARDPLYVARLRQSGSAQLVRAWLEGDWNIALGAFFDGWSARNIVPPFAIPDHWTRLRAFDWGCGAPFSAGWWAVAGDDTAVDGRTVPRGALVRYREWYGADRPGKGVRLTPEAVAAGILEREAGERIEFGVGDPSMFGENGGPSIGERMRLAGVDLQAADNSRVGKAGAPGGWDQMRARIGGVGVTPMLFVFSTCRDFIRTVPALRHDPNRPDDLDTTAEDHVADETRYACLACPLGTGERGSGYRPPAPPPSGEWKLPRPTNLSAWPCARTAGSHLTCSCG